MRKYYLFTIRKDYYDIYKKNPLVLYKTLENLYKLKKSDIDYGITLYNQICDVIDVDRLKNYFNHMKMFKKDNKYLIKTNCEFTVLCFHYACIICKTQKNYPMIFNTLNYYSKYFFVCDFYNHDYFFLDKSGIYLSKQKYNYS